MIGNYALLGLFAVAAVTFPIIPIALARLIRPRKPNRSKLATYECGLEFEDFPEEAQNVWVQFRVQYYIFALLFVVFDIEVVFLYPWAVAFSQTVKNPAILMAYFAEMFVFIVILIVALAYAWRKGLLEWT